VKHELLICALRNGEPLLFHVDCFAVAPVEPVPFGESFRRDTSLVPHLIKTWEENYFRPARCEIGSDTQSRKRAGARVGQNRYGFRACARNVRCVRQARKLLRVRLQTRTVTSKQAYFVEVVVPFLHLAWVRTQVNRPPRGRRRSGRGFHSADPQEQEILRWIHLGKSNIEIGAILGISPLTVKNHVQKILRKLNVQNRAQAVGRARRRS